MYIPPLPASNNTCVVLNKAMESHLYVGHLGNLQLRFWKRERKYRSRILTGISKKKKKKPLSGLINGPVASSAFPLHLLVGEGEKCQVFRVTPMCLAFHGLFCDAILMLLHILCAMNVERTLDSIFFFFWKGSSLSFY